MAKALNLEYYGESFDYSDLERAIKDSLRKESPIGKYLEGAFFSKKNSNLVELDPINPKPEIRVFSAAVEFQRILDLDKKFSVGKVEARVNPKENDKLPYLFQS